MLLLKLVVNPLPASARQEAGAAKENVETAAQAIVLVVDDDPDVRQFLTDSLDTFGYKTIAAADGAAGLDILDRIRPDLLIVDYAMPGMTGAQLASQARTKHPGLPILFASGYAETSALETALDGKALVLRKPFRLDVLQSAIAKAMRSN
jgi:CheY-like chemotaxis protein